MRNQFPEDVGGVLHVGNAGIAEGAHENGVESAHVSSASRRERLAGFQVSLGTEVEMLEGEPESERFGGGLRAP
jgi:hypothetical protein